MPDRVLYVDTSALVKLAVDEPETSAVRRELQRHDVVATSVVTEVELARASSNSAVPLKSGKLQALSARMSVLQAGTGPLRDVSASPVLADDIIDLAEARQLNAHPRSFVAPTADGTGLCLAGPGRMTCTNADDLAQSGASPAVVWNAAGQTHLFGFTTDDVDQVSVEFADGSRELIGSTANVLDAQLRGRPVAVRWEGPHGAEVLETSAPPAK